MVTTGQGSYARGGAADGEAGLLPTRRRRRRLASPHAAHAYWARPARARHRLTRVPSSGVGGIAGVQERLEAGPLDSHPAADADRREWPLSVHSRIVCWFIFSSAAIAATVRSSWGSAMCEGDRTATWLSSACRTETSTRNALSVDQEVRGGRASATQPHWPERRFLSARSWRWVDRLPPVRRRRAGGVSWHRLLHEAEDRSGIGSDISIRVRVDMP